MPPKSNVPIRICGSKTRTGCRTCKQRHVKCDESRPICSRCQKAGRHCVYAIQAPTQQSHALDLYEPLEQVARSTIGAFQNWLSPQGPNLNLSPYGPHESTEIIAIRNFTEFMGKELSGCFSDEIWCQVLPRVAQQEPPVWHAVVALGLMHSSLQLQGNFDHEHPNTSIAIRQYTKAIQGLNSILSDKQTVYCNDVVLLCCILFAIFECLQSHLMPAFRHISGGMKLLMQWERDSILGTGSTGNKYFDSQDLRPILLALDSQAVQMGAVDFREYCSLLPVENINATSTPFKTAQEAHITLNSIFNRLTRWSGFIEPVTGSSDPPDQGWIEQERQSLKRQLESWDIAFEVLSEYRQSQPGIMLLIVQRKVLEIYFKKTEDGPSEMEWDRSLEAFKEAVEYAETYITLTQETADPSSGQYASAKSKLVVTMDIVLPLFLISLKCRDPRIRRRALAMLKCCRRKEGIWDSYLTSQVAEKVIELEERGAAPNGYIPESARIFMLDIRLGDGRSGEIAHKKSVPQIDGSHIIETFAETVSW